MPGFSAEKLGQAKKHWHLYLRRRFYAAAAGIPAFAALFWKKATNAGIIAAMVSGFAVCVGWKLAGEPLGLGSAVPGTLACGIALVAVSLATCRKHPSVFLKAEKQS